MNQRRQRFLAAIAATGLLALPAFGWSQEADVLRLRLTESGPSQRHYLAYVQNEAGEAEESDERWIGVHVSELPAILRKHLKLEHGVLAEAVLPDTPAAKAGIDQGDVLLAVEGKEIERPEDVRDAIEAVEEGEGLTLEVLHEGEETTVEIVPAPRPADRVHLDPVASPSGAAASQQEFLKHQHQALKALERALADRQAAGMMFMRPGIVTEKPTELPKDVKVTITRRGDGPTKIVVERGDDRWEVTEKSLDELPEELRGPVAAMVHGPMPFSFKVHGPDDVIRVMPKGALGKDMRVEVMPPKVHVRRAPEKHDDAQFEAVMKELKSLKKQLEDVQRSLRNKE